MKITYEEWCELTGTTTDEMADAQEQAESEDWETELRREGVAGEHQE